MKKPVIIVTITLFLISSIININIALASSYILPSGGKDGSYWRPGSHQHISWNKFFLDTTKNLDIHLWNADNSTLTLIDSNILSTSEAYMWHIPNDQVLGENFKIKLTYTSDTAMNFYLMSDDFFSISAATPTLPFSSLQVYVVNPSSTISAYPNPASEEITITSANKFFSIELINSIGNLVYSCQFDYVYTHNINVSSLAAGNYSLRVKFLGSTVMENIIITR